MPTFHMFNLLWCGGYLNNITFIDADTKYRGPYLLHVS